MNNQNSKSSFNRRQFLKIAGVATAGASMAPRLVFAEDEYSDNILVFVFQRGGIDGLSFLAPMTGHTDRGHYEALRTNGTMLPSANLQVLSGGWGLHPAAAPLVDLWTNQSLAIVQAVGLPVPNRSHFEAERYVELGTPGNRFTTTGWLTRHLQTATNLPESLLFPAVITESTISFSLLRESTAVTMRHPKNFDLDSTYYEEEQEVALADIYGIESGELDVAGSQALTAADLIEPIDFFNYVPSNGAAYPTSLDNAGRLTSFGEKMRIIAQLIKENTGVRVAQADIGGWDTHNNQGNLPNTGWFYDNVRDLSASLLAFFTDLDVPSPNGKTWAERVTLICCSEFGRRAYDNADAGTDHGWGNNMLVIGGGVNGGKFYGPWPGLAEERLFQGADIFALTDYRTIFSEVLRKRLGNNQINTIFPGFTEAENPPLGVVGGPLPKPEIISRNGFE